MILRSSVPDVEIPHARERVRVCECRERPDSPAFIDGSSGRTLTYGRFKIS